ncbi:hypothetical protein A2U01_0079967, partial [Trifolium medium]|nr:hypothetical protein [Trifolium medium]
EAEEAEGAETGEGPSHVNPAAETNKEGGDTEEVEEETDETTSWILVAPVCVILGL